MPKPLKKETLKKPATKKRATRPSADPNRRAHQVFKEHMKKLGEGKWEHKPTEEVPSWVLDFEAQFKKRMSELGRKGGKASGAKRMENLTEAKRKEIAKKAAAARWKKG